MPSDPLLAQIERATYIAWAVTATIGLVCGFLLRTLFRIAARLTRMRVVSATLALALGALMFMGIQALRYQIEEAPFEPPVWIHPGWVSLYLPAVAIIFGVVVAGRVPTRMAAR